MFRISLLCWMGLAAGCAVSLEEIRGLPAEGRTIDLMPLLSHERGWVREEAARTLGLAGTQAAAPALENLVTATGERPLVRAAAARALGLLRVPTSLPVLVGVASAPGTPPEVKLALIDALCAFAPNPEALQAIAPLMTDEDLLVSVAATERVQWRCAH
jgi:HEAT repeat protein